MFTPYFRMKLWNRLQFSPVYVLNLMNSHLDTRQDIVIYILGKLDQIREHYLEDLMAKYEQLMLKKTSLFKVKSNLSLGRKLYRQIDELEEEIQSIT